MNFEQMLLSIIGQGAQGAMRPVLGTGSRAASPGGRARAFTESYGPLMELLLQAQQAKRSGLAELGFFQGFSSGLGGGGVGTGYL